MLQVDRSIICRDIAYLRQQSKDNIRIYIDERLPEEYEKCLVGITSIWLHANVKTNLPKVGHCILYGVIFRTIKTRCIGRFNFKGIMYYPITALEFIFAQILTLGLLFYTAANTDWAFV